MSHSLPIEFFVPIEVKAKQSMKVALRWKWADVVRCPFCRSPERMKPPVGKSTFKCCKCGANWAFAGRIKVPFLSHYADSDVTENATKLMRAAYQFAPDKPINDPLRLDIWIVSPWRKSDSAARMARAMWKDSRPDRDNLLKQVGDALEAAGFVTGDERFVTGEIHKMRADKPGLYVRISEPGEAKLPEFALRCGKSLFG